MLQDTATGSLEIKAPPSFNNDELKLLIKSVVGEVIGKVSPVVPTITIAELYERYMADPSRERSRKTIMTYQSVYNVLIELFGMDKQIGDITRDECRNILNIIRYLPANAKKKFPKKSFIEVSTLARERGMTPIVPQTINKYLSKLAAVLNWAVEEELLDHNPERPYVVL